MWMIRNDTYITTTELRVVQIMSLGSTDNILHFVFVPLTQGSYLRTAALLSARAEHLTQQGTYQTIKLYSFL